MAEPSSTVVIHLEFDPFDPPPWARDVLLLLAEGGAPEEAVAGGFIEVARGELAPTATEDS